MKMLEKMTRAVFEHRGWFYHSGSVDAEETVKEMCAVLEAMREPTPWVEDLSELENCYNAYEVWQAMIDAILSEAKGTPE